MIPFVLEREGSRLWLERVAPESGPELFWSAAIHRRFAFGLVALPARVRPPRTTPEVWQAGSRRLCAAIPPDSCPPLPHPGGMAAGVGRAGISD